MQQNRVLVLLVHPRRFVHQAMERVFRSRGLRYQMAIVASQEEAANCAADVPQAVVVLDCTGAGQCEPEPLPALEHCPLVCLVSKLTEPANPHPERQDKCRHFLHVRDEHDLSVLPMIVEQIVHCRRRLVSVQESEARFRLMADTAPVMLWISDESGRCTFFSKPWLEFRGRTLQQELGHGWTEGIHRQDRENRLQTHFAALGARCEFRTEYQLQRHDGRYRWILDHGTPRHLSNGVFIGYVGSAIDITESKEAQRLLRQARDELEQRVKQRTADLWAANLHLRMEIDQRKAAEAALRDGQNRYRTLVETAPHGIHEIDTEGVITFANAAYHRMYGYPEGAMIGTPVWDLAEAGGEAARLRARVKALLEDQPPPTPEFSRNHTRDGRLIQVRVDWDYLRDKTGGVTGFVSVVTDITEQRKAEEQVQRHLAEMAHIARLSTMGEMVSGLAHELNQPLSAISNYARASLYHVRSMAQDELNEVADSLEQIAGQADRAGEIIRHLRGFVRRADAERTVVDVNELAREITVLLEVDARVHHARLALVLDDLLPKLIGDRVQLEQVIANLVRNALEAMDETPPAERVVTVATARRPDGCVEIAIRDRGNGCRDGDADRWFEPFYTTKASGMGLGLSISRSIVESHGGRLESLPNPEGGSIFRFHLPVRAKENET